MTAMSPVHFKVGMAGRARWRVFNANTGQCTKDTGWINNLITDQGLDAIAQQADVMTHFTVGTSSTEPQETDTWVGAFVATSSNSINDINGVSGVVPHYGYRRKTIRFGVGAAAGNLSEGAIGWSATTGTAFSHLLIRDSEGDPTTITVLADEYLEFTYELRYIAPTVDQTGVVAISGINYNFTARALGVTSTAWWSDAIGKLFTFDASSEANHRSYSGNIAAITASVPGGSVGTPGTTSVTVQAYIAGTYRRDFTVSASPSQWNVAGGVVRSLVLGCNSTRWQAEFAKVSDGTGIGKTSGNSLSMNWRVSWARAA